MSYTIQNTGASLRFSSGDGFFFLLKSDIKAIKYVRDDMIKIDTGCCFNSLFIYKRSVTMPVAVDAPALAALLNGWLTDFLQGYPPPPPQE